MANERQTDYIIAELLKDAGINFFPNGSDVVEIQNALKTASKRGTDKTGFPEFTAVVDDFVIVIEDKAETKFQAKYLDEEGNFLLMDTKSITNYAENGALFYAWKIIQSSNFKKIIAFGCSGVDEKKIFIRPIFVNQHGYKVMKTVKNFSDFTAENIQRYHFEKVLAKKPVEQVELEDIIRRSKTLNEDLRNYGNLRDTEKPLVVSGILLALRDDNFSTEELGDNEKADGLKICSSISCTLDTLNVESDEKKSRLLDQFDFIKNRPYLSQFNSKLAKSPLRYFSEYIDSNVITAILNNSPEDVLGRFYSEFISYSGGDGQSLGIVLTPRHIAELFCDLAYLKSTDKVFDPCCGTATFLIAAMNRMLKDAKNDKQKISIKKDQLHGIELRDDMFSIATTNMILRGDGKSNLLCEDFLKIPAETLREKNFTVGFMNPPYSQAKKKVTSHLSELKFISHLLDSLGDNARCIVIVPQSTMVGKTSEDVDEKRYILANHTLEGVITLNPQTFYGVGTNPVIAVFTANQPHAPKKLVKFVDFKDDGYEVFPHIGLLATPRAPERKEFLLQCWHEGAQAPKSFIIRTPIKYTDEWLHSFYYFNDEIPSEKDFEKTMADYLSFEFSMIVHGRGYLFDDEKKNSPITEHLPPLDKKVWKPFFLKDLFRIKATKSGIDKSKLKSGIGKIPYVTRTDKNNGWDSFVCEQDSLHDDKNVLTVGLDTQTAFYQPTKFYTGQNIQVFSSIHLNKYVSMFVAPLLKIQMQKFNWGGNGATLSRLKALKILLPVDAKGAPDWEYMENFMRRIEEKLLSLYRNYITPPPVEDNVIVPLDKKIWKEFTIGELFSLEPGRGKGNNHLESVEDGISYLGATNRNNAVLDFVKPVEKMIQKGNCIAFIRNGEGSMGYAVYKKEDFIATADITVGYSSHLNEYTGKFLTTVSDMVRGKYSFNYKRSDTRLKKEQIKLPVDENGEPDWEYMEKYMRRQEILLMRRYFEKLSDKFKRGE